MSNKDSNKDSFKIITSIRPESSYTKDQIRNVKLITLNDNDIVQVFGSFTYRIQKYPGDLDSSEIFYDCCTIEDVLNKFISCLNKLIKRISKEKFHWITEMKIGIDKRYDINIGYMVNGVYMPNRQLLMVTSGRLFKEGLLSNADYLIITKILSNKSSLTADEYDIIHYIFREHKILRWNYEELKKGHKILPGDIKITIKQALRFKSDVKIDMIALVDHKFVEITNYIILAYVDKYDNYSIINFKDDLFNENVFDKRYDEQMKEEIEKLYYSNMYYSPFKMVKRIWAFSRFFKYRDDIFNLEHIISSDISLAYSLTSQLEAIIGVIKVSKIIPEEKIMKQLDDIKFKAAYLTLLDDEVIGSIGDRFNSYLLLKTKDAKIDMLKHVKDYLKDQLNSWTIECLNDINYNPPPIRFLPKVLKYNSSRVRRPDDHPRNPYQLMVKEAETSLMIQKQINNKRTYF
jgi:hypothetical protein